MLPESSITIITLDGGGCILVNRGASARSSSARAGDPKRQTMHNILTIRPIPQAGGRIFALSEAVNSFEKKSLIFILLLWHGPFGIN
jgi:hypothetical protein